MEALSVGALSSEGNLVLLEGWLLFVEDGASSPVGVVPLVGGATSKGKCVSRGFFSLFDVCIGSVGQKGVLIS